MPELMEAADQLIIASKGSKMLEETTPKNNRQIVDVLRQRLELELKASERCLESAVKFDDQYSKLLLRMIAADSMRHADVVSQIISWTELPREPTLNVPKKGFLDAILQIEDKAGEQSLKDTVKISHPIARLLLEWIDTDEKKHERIISKMVRIIQTSACGRYSVRKIAILLGGRRVGRCLTGRSSTLQVSTASASPHDHRTAASRFPRQQDGP